jgi:RNA polymerase sigma factor (sigma-70 family)
MANSLLHGVLRQLRRAARPPDSALSDGQLLDCFLRGRDEAAFEALLRRHGPMVLGVCRRILGNEHDAEDAFQATFLVLVHKGASVAAQESVGSWLYGVAFRTAQKARVTTARRRVKEKQMARPDEWHNHDDLWSELRPLLDQELSHVPDRYRAPIVLCDLEGHTRKEAARRLGCPEGTVSGRLSRGRLLLARRLKRHGLDLSAGAVGVVLAGHASGASLPVPLVQSTTRAATLVAAGHPVTAAVSGPAAALTQGVLLAMRLSQVKLALIVTLAVGLIGLGWGVFQTRAAAPVKEGETVAGPAIAAPVPNVPAKDDARINLPKGPAPVQVLASIDKDGKLVIKTANLVFRPLPVPPANGGPGGLPGATPPVAPVLPANPGTPPGAPAIAIGRAEAAWELQSQTYDLDDIVVLNTRGKKLDPKEVRKLLKEETVALASMWGQKLDPLHLRVIKEGTLLFELPMPKNIQGIGVPPVLVVPPALPGGPGTIPAGAAPTGSGVAVPGQTTTAPRPPTPE